MQAFLSRKSLLAWRNCRTLWASNRTMSKLGTYNWASADSTQSPNPSWTFGAGAPSVSNESSQWNSDLAKGYKTWDMQQTPPAAAYSLLISTVIPRPIAFVSSLSESGIPNLAPFSYFSLIGHNPPLISISVVLPTNNPKDTRANILSTREFTVNIISEPFVEAANSTSINAPPAIDEWLVSGLTQEPSISVKPARVQESAVSFECELYSSQDITALNSTTVTTTLILGLIKKVHVREAVLKDDGTVDPIQLRAVSRLGGYTYARVGDIFDIPRPSWKESQNVIAEVTSQKP